MMGESHFVLGGVATYAVLQTLGHTWATDGITTIGLAVTLGAVVALLPDIDSPNTLIRIIFGVGSQQARRNVRHSPNAIAFVINVVRLLIAFFLDGIAWLLPHRGPTHWLIVAVGLSAAVYGVVWWYYWPDAFWLAFVTGYVSHLFADSLTSRGLRLFAPFYDGSVGIPIRWLRIRTGSWQEGAALVILVALLRGWVIYW
jgi:inner membrane protein